MQADKKKVTRLLKTARGQIDGILKMIEEDRYCVDISHQIMASQAVLKNLFLLNSSQTSFLLRLQRLSCKADIHH